MIETNYSAELLQLTWKQNIALENYSFKEWKAKGVF